MIINPRVAIMREAVSKVVGMLATRKIRVTQQGSKAFVESDHKGNIIRVNLPYLPDDASDELLNAVQGYLDHEVGHVLDTDLQLLGKLGEGKPGEFKFLLNVLEDTYIERAMAQRFAGSNSNLEVTQQFVLDKVIKPAIEKDGPALNNLIMPLMRAMSGQSVMREFIKPYESLLQPITDALGPDFPAMVKGIRSTADTGRVADEFVKRLKQNLPPQPEGATDGPRCNDGEEGGDEEGEGDGQGDDKQESKSKKGKGKGKDKKDDKGDEKKPGKKKGKKEPKDEKGDDEGDGDAGETQDEKSGDEGDGQGEGDEAGEEKGGNEGDADGDGQDSEAGDADEGDQGDDPSDGEGQAGDQEDDADAQDGDEAGDVGDGTPRPQELDDDSEIEGTEYERQQQEHGSPGDANNDVILNEAREDLNELLDGMHEDGDYDAMMSKAIEQQVSDLGDDAEYLIWTTDYDRVEPLKIPNGFSQNSACMKSVEELIGRTEHMVSPMQKDLERAVAARSAAVYTAGHRSGRLHGPSLSRVLMNRNDVFKRKQENKTKNVAVSLVVDGSGSMSDKIETAASAAYALSMTLERLNIQNEVLAFTTSPGSMPRADAERLLKESRARGRPFSRHNPLYIPIIKEFHERITRDVKERFTVLANHFHAGLQSNVDGESILIAYRRLMQRREERKIMIVLSDGYPADMGNGYELRAHLKASVRMIESRGCDVVGIGIRSDAVKDFYRKAIVLQDIKELPNEVLRRLKELLLKVGN